MVELASDFRSPFSWLQFNNQKTAAYMDSALRNLFAKWEECRDSFHAVYPEVEIALAVDCSKVMRTHENTTKEQLAKCWEMVTDYAEENNVWPTWDRYVHDYTKGWWKLQQKSEVNITADSFEEQFKDLVSDSVNSNKSIYRTARLGTKCEACGRRNVSMIVAIVILSVLCICLIMAVVYLYNGNIFRKLGQRDHVKFQVLSEDVTF
ncbi:hypothetical protein Ocin01_20247 [Orchesella cincta]|uniref:Uncharacterized protein n=1 Tax=Orchesella cincta TaxID=48709 RepID=A0A1D2M0D7_ORCCI|nr:hypothetical protein Ocin01_20247 [Orchesella cincta]